MAMKKKATQKSDFLLFFFFGFCPEMKLRSAWHPNNLWKQSEQNEIMQFSTVFHPNRDRESKKREAKNENKTIKRICPYLAASHTFTHTHTNSLCHSVTDDNIVINFSFLFFFLSLFITFFFSRARHTAIWKLIHSFTIKRK